MANLLSGLFGKTRLVGKRQQHETKCPGFAEMLKASPAKYALIPPTSKSFKQFVRSIK